METTKGSFKTLFGKKPQKEENPQQENLNTQRQEEVIPEEDKTEGLNSPAKEEESGEERKFLDLFKSEKVDDLSLGILTESLEDVNVHDLVKECKDILVDLRRSAPI